MKKQVMLWLFTALALSVALTGCRTRMIAAPAPADTVLPTAAQLPEAPEETPPPPTEEAQPPEPDAQREPAPEAPSSETQATQDDVQPSRPETVDTLSQSGAAQLREQPAFDLTVTYDPNGGEGGSVRTAVHTGETYGIQPEAVRRGYAFAGWWTLPSGGGQVFSETVVTQEAAHTLYARWQEKRTCTITFDGSGGRVKTEDAHLELSGGDAYGVTPTPLREGYAFNGWFTASEGGGQILADSVFSGEDDLTLYAQWTYDPYEFWSFTLRNKTQQIYLCQQVSVYLELEQDNVTQQSCALIAATGSLNIAENRTDSGVTDDWVLGKKPQVVLKCVRDMGSAPAVLQAVEGRFPEQEVLIVSSGALDGEGAAGLYAKLALAKRLYGDWYTDVDLGLVAGELGVTERPVYF